jgi:hypothetical protein
MQFLRTYNQMSELVTLTTATKKPGSEISLDTNEIKVTEIEHRALGLKRISMAFWLK